MAAARVMPNLAPAAAPAAAATKLPPLGDSFSQPAASSSSTDDGTRVRIDPDSVSSSSSQQPVRTGTRSTLGPLVTPTDKNAEMEAAAEMDAAAGALRDKVDGRHRKSSVAAQAAYQRLAKERCAAAMKEAVAAAKKKETRSLPPGVWWGFHYFWPPELLKPPKPPPMEDLEFLRRVFRLMNDERIIDTFAIFDADGSGAIDSKELGGLIQMIVPNPHPQMVAEMVRDLDANKDGEIDLWEFCVHMQKRSEGLTRSELDMEMDAAFDLFKADENQMIDEAELRRIMQDKHTGAALTEQEYGEFVRDLEMHGLSFANGAKITLQQLRSHPCYTNAP